MIVLNYNGAHLLPDCLQSLLAQDHPSFEVLVVDSASVDESFRVVQRHPPARWISLTANQGLGPGYNAGAREAQGKKLFFVNNDTRFKPDCVRQLAGAFRGGDILAADPIQMDWAGTRVIHGAQRFRCGWRYLLRPIPFLEPYQDISCSEETEVPWGGAGALMFERKKFESLGGFDPSFFTDYEDLDICWRGWLRGWKTILVPTARLYHRVGETVDEKLWRSNPAVRQHRPPAVNSRRQRSQHKNAQRFVLKTMPWPIAFTAAATFLLKVAGHLFRCHGKMAQLYAGAMWLNIGELPEILKERRRILAQAVTTSRILLRRWGSCPAKRKRG